MVNHPGKGYEMEDRGREDGRGGRMRRYKALVCLIWTPTRDENRIRSIGRSEEPRWNGRRWEGWLESRVVEKIENEKCGRDRGHLDGCVTEPPVKREGRVAEERRERRNHRGGQRSSGSMERRSQGIGNTSG
jgi:hypothetical protein